MNRILLPLVYGACFLLIAHSARIERIGNEIMASTSGVEQPGATLLMDGNALARGRLFAFSAFVRNLNLAAFQVWRKTNNSAGNEYSLVSETRFTPTVIDQREDFYLSANFLGCPLIENGDKLGIYTDKDPSPVAYQFSTINPTSLMYVNDNVSVPYQIGDTVSFDMLPFPYMLSAAAYIDTDVENITATPGSNTVECPNLLIPEEVKPTLPPTTTKPPPTGAPGATGATGPMGQQGVQGPRGFQGDPGLNGTRGPTGPQGIPGQDGDDGLAGLPGGLGPEGPQGDTGASGAMGATGAIGPQGQAGQDGRDGRDGVNATWIIYTNNTGGAGAGNGQGQGGQTGGETGESVDGGVISEEIWMDPLVIFILVIWLIVVSIILLILTCAFCCFVCCRDKKEEDKDYATLNRQKSSNGTYVNVGYAGGEEFSSDPDRSKKNLNRLSSFEPGEQWISTMKQDDTVNYENSTIERDASRKQKPAPLAQVPTHVYEGDGTGKKIPKTPDSVLDDGAYANADEIAVDVPETPNHPAPPPLPGAEGGVSTSPNGTDPTDPDKRWSQSQDQMIAY